MCPRGSASSLRDKINYETCSKSRLTFDVFVVSAVSGLLTQIETLLLTGHEGSDGDAVLLAHHALGRRLVHLEC